VRFRVEFTIGAGAGSGNGMGRGSYGGSGHCGCTMTFVQEKGSVSAFRAVCARLRSEWTLEPLEPQTPGVQQNGFGGDDVDVRLMSV